MNAPAPYLFVSYASADRERVLTVVERLEAAGVRTWIDREGIHGGANYAKVISDAIKGSAALLLCASPASLASRNVRQELALGWRYERPYLPLLLDPVEIPDELAYWLEGSQWIELLDHPEPVWLSAVSKALDPLGIHVQMTSEPSALPVAVPLTTQLVGRQHEQASLQATLDAAQAGRGSLVLIGGEAGMGKTSLADWVLAGGVGRGWAVLEGHCFDLADTPPYGPFIDLFARYVPGPGDPPLPETFARRGRVEAVSTPLALFVQVRDFLGALAARRPVVALLDDLHWADPASLDLLRYLARGLGTLPVLLLVTYRSDEVTRRHPLYALLPQLARETGAVRLDLGALDEAAVRALIATRYALTGDDGARLAAYVQGRAEGNALFVGEVLRSLEEAGTVVQEAGTWRLGALSATEVPPLLRQVIDSRLDRLGETARSLLAVAAVLGQEVSLDLWAAVGVVDEDALVDVVERGAEARLLVEAEDGERVRFVHALIRETLYEGLTAARRRRLHRQAGEALSSWTDPNPDAVAYHFERARDPRATGWLVAAGDRADRLGAYVTAFDRHERALRLLDDDDATLRGWLLVRLGLLQRHSDLGRALSYLEGAEPAVRASGDRVLTAYWQATQGLVRCLAGHGRAGLPDLRAGVAAIRALPDDDRAEEVLPPCVSVALETDGESTYADWLAILGNLNEGRGYGEALLAARTAEAGNGDAQSAGDVNFGLALTYAGLGRPDAATRAATRARDAYRELGNYVMAIMASRLLVRFILLPYGADRGSAQRAAYEEMTRDLALLVDGGAVPPDVANLMAKLLDSDSAAVAGRWTETRQAAMEVLQRELSSTFLRQVGASHAMIARGQGDAEVAWRLVRLALPDGAGYQPGDQAVHIALPLQQLAPALSLDAHDLPNARAWLEAHDRWLEWSGAVLGQVEGALLWAQYHHANGDWEQARQHGERALAHASDPRQPLALIAVHRFLGQLDVEDQQFDAAEEHLQESLRLADACAAPFERALTLLEVARLRVVHGQVDEARARLAEVRALCEPLEARPTLERAAALEQELMARERDA